MLYGSVVRLVAPMRRRALEALAAAPGERVLDLACGPGPGPAPDFGPLRDAVGPAGEAVGLDYGEGVVRRDRERVDEGGWENVDVVRADAREEFDPGAGYLAVARRAGRGV